QRPIGRRSHPHGAAGGPRVTEIPKTGNPDGRCRSGSLAQLRRIRLPRARTTRSCRIESVEVVPGSVLDDRSRRRGRPPARAPHTDTSTAPAENVASTPEKITKYSRSTDRPIPQRTLPG